MKILRRTSTGTQYFVGNGKFKQVGTNNALLLAAVFSTGPAVDCDETAWTAVTAVLGPPS